MSYCITPQPRRLSSRMLALVDLCWREILFASLLLFVAAVSVHDAALVVLLDDLIADFERNPVGCWLIEVAHGSIWLFLFVKLFGTAVVSATQVMIYQRRPQLAWVITSSLASFQFGLLLYLSLG
jgi:hypothetical protein